MARSWWQGIPQAEEFIDSIVNDVTSGKSAILVLPRSLPWPNEFHDTLYGMLDRYSSNLSINRLEDNESRKPGEIVMRKFIKEERRSEYRPGIGYAEFLASDAKSTFNQALAWVNIEERNRAGEWIDFVGQYVAALHGRQGGIFIIEIHDTPDKLHGKGLAVHVYDSKVSDFDSYVFYMLRASELQVGKETGRYLAELALSLAGRDVELGDACLSRAHYEQFMRNPCETMKEITAEEQRSDGREFNLPLAESRAQRLIWQSQVKIMFPILEDFRSNFIDKHQDEIKHSLPVTDGFGNKKTDPGELELGSLSYMAWRGMLDMADGEKTTLNKCKAARNDLAHLAPMEYDRVSDIMEIAEEYR